MMPLGEEIHVGKVSLAVVAVELHGIFFDDDGRDDVAESTADVDASLTADVVGLRTGETGECGIVESSVAALAAAEHTLGQGGTQINLCGAVDIREYRAGLGTISPFLIGRRRPGSIGEPVAFGVAVGIGWQRVCVIQRVRLERDADLPLVGTTIRIACPLAATLKRRQKNGEHDHDDRHYGQHFGHRESSPATDVDARWLIHW